MTAATFLHRYTNWELVEGTNDPAGLACTIPDEKSFQWDIGVRREIAF
jgi:hypothetical protein